MTKPIALLVLSILPALKADSYIQNPRGSNNKLNEQSNNVNNNRRLYDSQNNGNSGYQVGDACVPNCLDGNQYDVTKEGAGQGIMEYYEGSYLTIEWNNQHGSQSPYLHNNFVLQYMCDDGSNPYNSGIRDGITTDRIPLDPNDPNIQTYGQHENHLWYGLCAERERNNGLYKADQNLPRESRAIHTRQDRNNNNNRYGLECPEERDYYPYWHPTPWRDIWFCSDTPGDLCPMVERESQNVVDKGNCSLPFYNNERACRDNGGSWSMTGKWNMMAPNCTICPTTRNNHNGNTNGDTSPTYTWQVPFDLHPDGAQCVLRLRYNVSTYDFEDPWNTFADKNGANSVVKNNPVKDWVGFGFNVSGPLRLNIDTSQFGRTFEDRTHLFRIKKRPENLPCGIKSARDCNIFNVNVRGRRGNIQQTYPAVEYDIVPNLIKASVNDYLHIQWTGSDANNQGNAGNGRAGTDRNNMVVLKNIGSNVPTNLNPLIPTNVRPMHFSNDNGTIAYMAFLNQTGCNDEQDNTQADDNCKTLNRAPGYVNVGLVRVENSGTYYLMSTRNNAFTNREQKATLVVEEDYTTIASAVAIGLGGLGFFVLLGFAGLWYAKSHPQSKLNKVYGTNKPELTAEFDDDMEATSNAELVSPVPGSSFYERHPTVGAIAEWYKWNKPRVVFFLIFGLINTITWVYGYVINLGKDASPYYPYAKGFGKVLDINLGFVLIPVLRNFISFLRTTAVADNLPLDDNLLIHTVCGFTIALAGSGHIFFHYMRIGWLNYWMAQSMWLNSLGNLPGITGHLIFALMFCMFCTAMLKRKIYRVFGGRFDGYAVFLNVHRLWMPAYFLLILHGAVFWHFAVFPLMFMALEKYIQAKRVKVDVKIVEAQMTGRDVLGVKMMLVNARKKFHYKAGQYLFLNCPDLGLKEFHPFTITSAPEDGYFSCHIRCRSDMDWTYSFRKRLGFAESVDANGKAIPARKGPITAADAPKLDLPLLRVDGPYGSAAEEVFDYDTVILVGAGIGVTPFISILKSMMLRLRARTDPNDITNVHFYWVCRDMAEFDSFKDLFDQIVKLKEISKHLELNMYVTGELNLKNIRVEEYNQFSGKPNWNRIFKEKASAYKGHDIGVFLCGPAPIAQELQRACKTHSTKRILSSQSAASDSRTIFKFHKENF